MLFAMAVLSLVLAVSVVINVALLNRLLAASKIAPIEIPKFNHQTDTPEVERRKLWSMRVGD